MKLKKVSILFKQIESNESNTSEVLSDREKEFLKRLSQDPKAKEILEKGIVGWLENNLPKSLDDKLKGGALDLDGLSEEDKRIVKEIKEKGIYGVIKENMEKPNELYKLNNAINKFFKRIGKQFTGNLDKDIDTLLTGGDINIENNESQK